MLYGSLLTLHLVLVSLAGGLPVVNFIWEWAKPDLRLVVVGQRIAGLAVAALLTGTLSGVLLGILAWDAGLAQAVRVARSRVVFGGIEWLFSLVLMVLYWWIATRRAAVLTADHAASDSRLADSHSTLRRLGRSLLPLLAATNLLYHFPLLFALLNHWKGFAGPDTPVLSSAEVRAFLFQTPVLVSWVHFVFASLLLSLLVAARWCAARELFCWGRWLVWPASVISILQWPLGIATLVHLPRLVLLKLTELTWPWWPLLPVAFMLVGVLNWILWRAASRGRPRDLSHSLWAIAGVYAVMVALKTLS